MRVSPPSPKLKLRFPQPRPLKAFALTLEAAKKPVDPEKLPRPAPPRAQVPTAPEPARPRDDVAVDTATRTAVLLSPPPSAPPPVTARPSPIPHQLATELLEKAAFWGDGERGIARLRFGSRARAGLAGATVTLEHDGDAMHLRVEDCDDPALIEQLREQLARRGVVLSEP